MKIAELKDRIVFGAARVWYRNSMAEVAERTSHAQFEASVAAVRELNSSMRRITLAAPEFTGYDLAGPDEYFGLLVPGADGALHMPDGERYNVRAAVAEMPEEQQPGLRWYTLRELRRSRGEVDVDIVTHGDSGPGSAWAVRAVVGDTVGFRSGGALYTSFEPPCQLLVADETAVPALLAIVEERARRGLPGLGEGVAAHVEVPSTCVLDGVEVPAGITVHERGDAAPGTAVLAALAADPSTTAGLDYAWACGESGLATSLRRHLVAQGMDKKAITFSGYWKLGAARG
ncbi:siderophore-interacting protein [Janibacter cremeus]|uniref:NADPH-dependent ferric siderophore reductase n=1 Tax=Janibacter cremeus TaxID=1285192 RepID=A0A852VQS3_9MICO|nr:siderophore-interacting protein [Janibacter cremeus]NYF98566.1 NADPH-dependent ferric siderophore reductase [Janibacter cremeus]